MPTNAAEVVVGANGQVFFAPTGTVGPDSVDAVLDDAFLEAGYTSEDGATLSDSRDIEDINAWQSLYPIRRIVTGKTFTVATALRQWNADNIVVALGGGTVSAAPGGGFQFEPADPSEIDERAMVLDWQDGDKNFRLYIPRGIISENVETNLNRSSAADLPITFAALPVDDLTPAFTLFTDDPAFAPAGS